MKRIPTLDGWRAIAISMVIAHHSATVLSGEAGHAESQLMFRFALGVDVFFAISGLLITSRLLAGWRDRPPDLRDFYIRRAFRILPSAVLYLATLYALGLFASTWEWASSLTFWRNYVNKGEYTGHFWSLSLEEQFYLIWPLMLVTAGRQRGPHILFRTILVLNIWRALYLVFDPYPSFLRSDLRGDGLLWGCLAAFVYADAVKFRIPGALSLVCAICAPGLFLVPFGMPLFPVAVTTVVLSTVQHPEWLFSRFLESRPLAWIGQRSYGIYVWQQLFVLYPFGGGVIALVWRLAALVVFAALSYRLFEIPLQNLGRRIAARMYPRSVRELSQDNIRTQPTVAS